MRRAIVSLSGGMDSATVLAEAVSWLGNENVACYGFVYGSKHNKYENYMAVALSYRYDVPFTLIDLSTVMEHFKSDLLLSGGDIPEGHYEHESMSRTVVPYRNMIFISILSGIASSNGFNEIWLGVHAGDHHIYPDCRPMFIRKTQEAILLGDENTPSIVTPFLNMSKGDIVKRGIELSVPYELTRTCYKQQEAACGKCGSCVERLEAFADNNVTDPIIYEKD